MMRQSSGIALVSALIFMVIVVILLSIATTSAINNQRNAGDMLRTSQAQFAAEAGLEDALVKVWHEIRWSEDWVNASKDNLNLTTYSTLLNKIGLEVGKQISGGKSLPDGSRYDFSVRREDNVLEADGKIKAIVLQAESRGTLPDGKTVRQIRQRWEIKRDFFPFDFALLTNKAECVFCHVDIKSMDAFKGTPSASNPWKRTKVGVLEDLIMRDDEEAGIVHGSILTRGTVRRQKDGATGVSDRLFTSLTPGDNRITADNQLRPTIADCSIASNCSIVQNFYRNYPDSTPAALAPFGGKFPDGPLPDAFPLPVRDVDANRAISDQEWNDEVNSSISGNSDVYPNGSITAAMQENPTGTLAWDPGKTPTTRDSEQLGLSPTNLIIDGAQTPIDIKGTIFVNGDVIIRGKVQGNGTIVARGNIYILGDVTYFCGNDPCDYKNPSSLPSLSLVAVGNILVGDYLSVNTGQNTSNSKEPIDLSIKDQYIQGSFSFCRRTDLTDEERKLCGRNTAARDQPDSYEYRPNFALTEIANFNRSELYRFLTGKVATPRFYRYSGDTIYYAQCKHNPDPYDQYRTIQAGNIVDVCEGDKDVGDIYLTPEDVTTILSKMAVYELNPSAWQSPNLKNLWIDSGQGGLIGREGALRLDGLMYSANAIFAVAPSDNNGSYTQGKWDLRGGLVAADTGVFTQQGLTIYHDSRLRPRIVQEQVLQVIRGEWQVVKRTQ